MKRKKIISIDQLIKDAAMYLAAGKFFIALELGGLAEWYLNEQVPDLHTEFQRTELKKILDKAEHLTDLAIEEMLPKKGRKAA